MPANQPTILVKKADGTFARMTLDEIKKMRSGAPRDPSTPLRSARDDNRPMVSANRLNQVDEAQKKLRFSVPADLQNRLRSIIQLRLKDIRSAEQTKDKVKQAIKDGGLGLGDKEAEELSSVCDIILGRETKNKNLDSVPVLKRKAPLPMVEPEELPTNTAPFNAFVHGEKRQKDSRLRGNDSKERGNDRSSSPAQIFPPRTVAKTVMEDVTPPKPVEMGPIEEIQYMTWIDFHRLSAKPAEAAARLKQKFLNLRDESVLLYIDALSAWHKSPLYADYMKAVCQSLKERRKLSASLGGAAGKINLEDILALVKMEGELE